MVWSDTTRYRCLIGAESIMATAKRDYSLLGESGKRAVEAGLASAEWIEACAADDIEEEDLIRFNYKTGEALAAPVCDDLKTYPVKVEGGTVFIQTGD